MYFICKKGNRWAFDDRYNISQLITNEQWGNNVICDD